jgi:hypothetical protein
MKQTNCLLCLIGVLLLICIFVPYETFTCQKYSTFANDTYNSLITKDMYNTIYSDSTSSSFWDNYDGRITTSFGYDDPIETNTDFLHHENVRRRFPCGSNMYTGDEQRLSEGDCLQYKNLGWCISNDGGSCKKGSELKNCDCYFQSNGRNKICEKHGICPRGNKGRIKQKYEYYDECINKNCRSKGKCFGKEAGTGNYVCVNCTGSNSTNNTDYCEKNYGCWDKDTPNEPRAPRNGDGPSNCNSFNIPKNNGYTYFT